MSTPATNTPSDRPVPGVTSPKSTQPATNTHSERAVAPKATGKLADASIASGDYSGTYPTANRGAPGDNSPTDTTAPKVDGPHGFHSVTLDPNIDDSEVIATIAGTPILAGDFRSAFGGGRSFLRTEWDPPPNEPLNPFPEDAIRALAEQERNSAREQHAAMGALTPNRQNPDHSLTQNPAPLKK